MKDNELIEYTAFIKTRKALIDGNLDDAVKAFREFQSRKENTLGVQHSNDLDITQVDIGFKYRLKLAYVPMWKFLKMVIDAVHPDRSASVISLPTVIGNNVLAIYNGKHIKYIDCNDAINYFKLSKWDTLDIPCTQFDIVKRNTPDMERDLKTTYFYDYFDKSYIFDDGSVMPGDFMTDAYVMVVTQYVLLVPQSNTSVYDYNDSIRLGETYYRFNENGNPIKCCIVKFNGDNVYEVDECDLVYGHRSTCTLNKDTFKLSNIDYYPADFNYVDKYYLPVVVNDVVETMGGLPLKVFDVERNKYNAVASFKAHALGRPEQFVFYNGFGEALNISSFTEQEVYAENKWLDVSKIITDPERDLLTFVGGDDFVKEYTLFYKEDNTFYESFNTEECNTLSSIFNKHDRVSIGDNGVDLSKAITYLSTERKGSKVIRNVTVSPNILNNDTDFNNSIVKMFRGKTFSNYPVTVYQNDKIHLLFKTGNGLCWYIVRPSSKGVVLNISATDSKYKPKQKRYDESYTSYSLSYNGY